MLLDHLYDRKRRGDEGFNYLPSLVFLMALTLIAY